MDKIILENVDNKKEVKFVSENIDKEIVSLKRIGISDKSNLAKYIVGLAYNITYDKEEISSFSMMPDYTIYELIKIGLIGSVYIQNIEVPKNKDGNSDYIIYGQILDTNGVFEELVTKNKDVSDTLFFIERELESFEKFIDNNLKKQLLDEVNHAVSLFNELEEEKINKQKLDNKQLDKIISMMPDSEDGMKNQITILEDEMKKAKESKELSSFVE